MLHATELLGEIVDLAINPIKTCLDGGQIVPIAARLFENMAPDHLLALDLLGERDKFFSGNVSWHSLVPSMLLSRSLVASRNASTPMACFLAQFTEGCSKHPAASIHVSSRPADTPGRMK
jgi:hypothetical protein